MKTEADSKGRVALPGAEPGDVFDVQEQGEGRYLLARLQSKTKMSREDCLRAMEDHPIRFRLTWEKLVRLTREP